MHACVCVPKTFLKGRGHVLCYIYPSASHSEGTEHSSKAEEAALLPQV